MTQEEAAPVFQITEGLRIRRQDVHNIVLEQRYITVARSAIGQRKASEGGKERWGVLGYYASLRDALEAVPEQVIEPAPLVELRQAFAGLDQQIAELAARVSQEGPAF